MIAEPQMIPGTQAALRLSDQISDLILGDCIPVMERLLRDGYRGQVRTVFADPPYGMNRTAWDRPMALPRAEAFHAEWLGLCQELLEDDGTLWVCGDGLMLHVVGVALARLGMPIISAVTIVKPNARPWYRKQKFINSTECILWAATRPRAAYTFEHELMRQLQGGKFMTNAWHLSPATQKERACGRHPTQKALQVVERCLRASTRPGELVLDPFMGSGTTAVAAHRHGFGFIGIEQRTEYLQLARRRVKAERCGRREAVAAEAAEQRRRGSRP